MVRAERDQSIVGLSARIADAVATGELHESVDVTGLSRTIAALIQGMSVQARDGASCDTLRKLVATVEILLAPFSKEQVSTRTPTSNGISTERKSHERS